jgi:uncharacterized protein YxjI
MERISSVNSLIVQQKKEWGEIVTGFETKNKYIVMDPGGRELYYAAEEGGSALLRIFLKALRPFEMYVVSPDGQTIMRVNRPFRFFFHRIEVFDGTGQLIGAVERRFSILRRFYSVMDRNGNEGFQLFGPILHPWTFEIKQNDRLLGKITKKWSGMLKEGFTDADNFGVSFPMDWSVRLKALFLGAVFLIDFVHFENKGNN